MIIENETIKGKCSKIIDYLTSELSKVLIDKTILLEDKITMSKNINELLETLCYNYTDNEIVECIQTPMGNWNIK